MIFVSQCTPISANARCAFGSARLPRREAGLTIRRTRRIATDTPVINCYRGYAAPSIIASSAARRPRAIRIFVPFDNTAVASWLDEV